MFHYFIFFLISTKILFASIDGLCDILAFKDGSLLRYHNMSKMKCSYSYQHFLWSTQALFTDLCVLNQWELQNKPVKAGQN